MSTKKELTLKAIGCIIERYKKKKYTGRFRDCPLCQIHAPKRTGDVVFLYHSEIDEDINGTCLGCPNMTIDNATYIVPCRQTLYFIDDVEKGKYFKRIRFWKKLLPYLEKCPDKMFTKNAKELFDHSIVKGETK